MTDDRLEPNASRIGENLAACSIAISLKRITDALEKLTTAPTMPPLTEEQIKEFENSKPFGIIVTKS